MTTYVSNRNGGETDEQGHYRFQTKMWTGNVLSGLAVTQNSPLARNVLVPTGDLKIDYGQYAFTAWNDAAVTVALGTADTTNPRIDRIIAYVDLAVALGTTNNPGVLKFTAVAGTPAGSPTKASDGAVNTAVGASNPWCEIATVRVEANATTIPNSKITDTRTMVTLDASLIANIMDMTYPVGSIYTNASVSTNPATLLGFGTWVAFGVGRVLVGVGTSDRAFAAATTGGESNHTLTNAEMPVHNHSLGSTTTPGGGFPAATYGGTDVTTASSGSGLPHNNLQPYIVVYMWVRTA